MKKLIILTSLFAISACTTGNENKHNFQQESFESNKLITSMVQKTDSAHTLDDVRFTSSDTDNYFTFNLDKHGKIREFMLVDKISGEDKVKYQRYADQNVFGNIGNFYKYDPKKGDLARILENKYTGSSINKDSIEEIKIALQNIILDLLKEGKITRAEAITAGNYIHKINHESRGMETEKQTKEIEILSFGKDKNLKYSDFGFLKKSTIRDSYRSEDITSFFGGYNSKNITKEKNKKNLVFNGKAVGFVKNKNYSSEPLMLSDDNAKFTFDINNQSETLSMKFDNWYNVEVKKDNSSPNSNSIKFLDGGKEIDDRYKFTSKVNEEQKDFNGKFDTSYYGDDNRPTEVVGNVSYEKSDIGDEKIFKASFGGKIN